LIQASDVTLIGIGGRPATTLPSLNLKQNLDWVERETVRRALEDAAGVKKDAAEALGISQRAMSYYVGKHRLEDP
jgi:transcriptional regulator with GAF, ATPase, and Fis domain